MIKREINGDEAEALVLEILKRLSGLSIDTASYVLRSAKDRLSTVGCIVDESIASYSSGVSLQ
jgi:hypothetical protein